MPSEIEINEDRLRELASNPKNKVKDIVAGLGMSDPTFYQQLGRKPELKTIYDEARAKAREARGLLPRSAKAPAKRAAKKSSKKSAAPPPATRMPKAIRSFSKSCCMNLNTSIFTVKSPTTLTSCATR